MNRSLLLATTVCIALAATASAQVPPEKCLSTFTVADGLQIELFAAEPMLINPTSIDIDHKGRVWVCEAVNYRRVGFGRPILRPEGDRIQVLIDETGEGKATKAVTFYQGKDLYAPLGIAIAPYPDGKGQKVFVCQSPDILVFEDKDGDLKADGPPKKFLTNFGGFDHDHGVHGINIGPDGKLYFTVGDAGVRGLQASDGKGPKFVSNGTDCRAGTVWRCDMDGTHVELIAHNFRNNYECCVNSFGEVWLSDNDDDGNQQTRICYVMPGGNYGYHPRGPGQTHWHEEQPGIVHKAMRTGFGSPTGICFYEGNLLPKKYQGQLLHCDAGPREFRCFHIKPKGAGYELEKELLVTSTDNWFRLSDVCVAPDGSVFLADWYDPGVGGHGMGDWTRGRIYRVTPKGHKGYKVPEIKFDTKENVWAVLESPCKSVRWLGIQAIRAMKIDNAIKVVDPNETFRKQSGFSKARLLWAITPPLMKAARKAGPLRGGWVEYASLVDEDDAADIGPTIFRIDRDMMGLSFMQLIENDALKAAEFVNARWSQSPAVRREILLASHDQHPAKAKMLFYPLAKLYDGQDHFYRAALNIACGTDPARRDAILADFEKHFPEWNDKVADLVWELRPKSMMTKMEKLLADAKLTGVQKARIIDILASSDDLSAGESMLSILKSDAAPEVKSRAIDSLKMFLPTKWKGLQKGKQLDATIDDLLKSAKTQISALQLIGAVGAVDRVKSVIKLTQVEVGNDAIQDEAVRTLTKLKCPEALDALTTEAMMGTRNPSPTLRVETALRGLGAMITGQQKDELGVKAMAVLQKLVASDSMGGWQPRRVLSVEILAGSRQGTDWLLKLKESGKMPAELEADAGKFLRNSPFQGQRNKALLLFPAPGKLDPKKLPAISVLANRSGNADKGKQLLAASIKGETQCLRCHTIRGVGGSIGPDLSMIGSKASKENLLESILVPSKAIADQYLQWTIENTNGQKITGLLVEESPAGVTIRDANGKDTKIAKDDIEKRTKSLVSIMPEDVVKGFTEDDLIDVVAYLFTLKTPSLTPDVWHIVGPFDNDAADKGLDAVYAPETSKSIDLSASYKGKSGEVKWKSVRQNGAGYVDLQAFYAPKSANIASYVYQRIESQADQEATILVGNDDGVKIWVNGELVLTNRDHFAASPEQHKVAVKLKKGGNDVLMKIVNGEGAHGFYMSIASKQELKLTPVTK